MENRNAKSLLAKLMAAEDINVEYSENASTASFDTERRVLRMPIFKDITDEATDLFLGHEVGHALYTPQGEILKVLEKGGLYKNFVNVVEDARIEKKIQKKFPGLRRCFFGGYNELMERDFFGTNGKDINDYNLIDRLNIHFKAGVRAGVEFAVEEMTFVNRMASLLTWEETIALSDDLYEYCKNKEENEEPETSNSDVEETESGDGEDGEGEASSNADTDPADNNEETGGDEKTTSSGSGETNEDDEADDGSGEESGSEEGDTTRKTGEGGLGGSGNSKSKVSDNKEAADDDSDNDELVSTTQDSFNSKLEDLVDTERVNSYYHIPKMNLKDIIISMDEIHAEIDNDLNKAGDDYKDLLPLSAKKFKEFSSEQKSLISYLIKEFEMRKSADEHKRTREAKTGILNPNKLHAFKFSEDIFLRNSVVSDGKNHGFVMFVDWSGSMHGPMSDTIDQLMMLAMFCKKAQIPFDVFAFTTGWKTENRDNGDYYKWDDVKENDIGIFSNFKLLHLISSTLKTSAFNKSMTYVTYLRNMFQNRYVTADTQYYPYIGNLGLAGTPLNEAVMAAMEVIPAFQKKNSVQIVNTIFLTDGQGSNRQRRYDSTSGLYEAGNGKSIIVDPVTKKQYNKHLSDKLLLEILKDRTGTTLAGFFISTGNKKSFTNELYYMNADWDKANEYWDALKKEGFCVIDGGGYDEFYILSSKRLEIKEETLQINSDMTKGRMKNAFVKAQQGKIANKKMLSRFAELVA